MMVTSSCCLRSERRVDDDEGLLRVGPLMEAVRQSERECVIELDRVVEVDEDGGRQHHIEDLPHAETLQAHRGARLGLGRGARRRELGLRRTAARTWDSSAKYSNFCSSSVHTRIGRSRLVSLAHSAEKLASIP